MGGGGGGGGRRAHASHCTDSALLDLIFFKIIWLTRLVHHYYKAIFPCSNYHQHK